MLYTALKKRIKKLKRGFLILIGLYIMIGTALYYFQEKLMFLPTTLAQNFTYQFSYPFEELFLQPEANVSINAIHFKAKNPKGVILYFHGNAGDLSRWGVFAEEFVAKDYDVFILDYRSYGKSKGALNEAVFYTDAQFCYDYLLKQYAEREITVYGRSLGTGIAAHLASKNQPKQLILETPYYSITDVAASRFPILPVKYLLKYRFPTFKFLPKVKCPITIIHGTADAIVPYASSQKLLELQLENLNFITIEGGNHNNLIEFDLYNAVINTALK